MNYSLLFACMKKMEKYVKGLYLYANMSSLLLFIVPDTKIFFFVHKKEREKINSAATQKK